MNKPVKILANGLIKQVKMLANGLIKPFKILVMYLQEYPRLKMTILSITTSLMNSQGVKTLSMKNLMPKGGG